MIENNEWKPPPPPENDSMFSSGTREFYAEKIKTEANKALVCGILSLLCCPPVFAFLAINSANEALSDIDLYDVSHDRRGLAQAGKILAAVGIVVWVVGLIFRISNQF